MSYSWAKPGVKVVCVDDGRDHHTEGYWEHGAAPVVGKTYSIESVSVDWEGYVILTFKELSRGRQAIAEGSYGYAAYRFRPLVTKTQKQDVARFAHLLNTSRVDA